MDTKQLKAKPDEKPSLVKIKLRTDLIGQSLRGYDTGDYKEGEIVEAIPTIADKLISHGNAEAQDRGYEPTITDREPLSFAKQHEVNAPSEQFSERAERLGLLYDTTADDMLNAATATIFMEFLNLEKIPDFEGKWRFGHELKALIGEERFEKLDGIYRNGCYLIPRRIGNGMQIAIVENKATLEKFSGE